MCSNIVLIFQTVAWILASLLLLHGGVSYLTKVDDGRNYSDGTIHVNVLDFTDSEGSLTVTSNQISGIIMIIFGIMMLLVIPLILFMRYSHKRKKYLDSLLLVKEDLPPKYEDVVETAPTYSTLFLNV